MNLSRTLLVFIVFLVVGISGASAGQYSYVVPPEDLWSCFDYAMHYSQDNPDSGIVLISSHPRFRGIGNSHFVNYQINDKKQLIIYGHDHENTITKVIDGWQYDTFTHQHYHFYLNGEIPTRYFSYKLPNAVAVYNAL